MADENKNQDMKENNQNKIPVMFYIVMIISIFITSYLTSSFFSNNITKKLSEVTKNEEKINTGDKKESENTVFYKLGEFIVNLANKESTRYVKTDITIEVMVKKEKKELLKEKEAIFRDIVINKISTYTTQQLSNPEGKKRLKEDLIKEFNSNIGEFKIVNLYYNSFMMQ